MVMAKTERQFLPAAGHDWFLPLYDPITKIFGMDRARVRLLEQAGLQPHYRVLDVGCGTGTLAVQVKQVHPMVDVVAADPDPKALARAWRKAERAGVSIQFDEGFSDALNYADAVFDRVFSSMMLHHVKRDERENTLREIRRVLKPGGRLEFLDFDQPEPGTSRLARLLHSNVALSGNTEDRLLASMARAGFVQARRTGREHRWFGRLGFYQAAAPQQ